MPTIKRHSDKLPWVKQLPKKDFARKVDNKGFYNSKHWRKLSKLVRQEQPLCEVAKHFGLTIKADVTDHVIRVEEGGAKLDRNNLMAMSHHYHNIKSGKEKHKGILIQYVLNNDGDKIPLNRNDIFKTYKKPIV